MNSYLLLGAGFSRNWGGWLASEVFEYLLGCPEICGNAELRDLLWRFQPQGGFEAALANLQSPQFLRNSEDDILSPFQSAIRRMFKDMNHGLSQRRWEFQQESQYQVTPFLAKFDAIFTLNQDMLLEQHYCGGVELSITRKWSGVQFLGMKSLLQSEPFNSTVNRFCSNMMPEQSENFTLNSGAQPIFKLHGSSNWMFEEGNPMLIMGGEKVAEIEQIPILAWYANKFQEMISLENSRLMVIGYSFNDRHINKALLSAIRSGLKVFIVSPDGAETFSKRLKSNCSKALDEDDMTFQKAIIGASRRPLNETFNQDVSEWEKFQNFFKS